MKIVADDKIPFLEGVLEPFAEVVFLPGETISNTDLKDADALLTRSVTPCNESLLAGTGVKLIATATIGDDHIDKAYCAGNGIRWETAKGCNAAAVNDYVISALLRTGIGLEGRTLAVIGVGDIGTRVVRSAQILGMNTLLYDPPRQRVEDDTFFTTLNAVWEQADIVSFHVPLTGEGMDKTYHMAADSFFEGFKKPVSVINTARGGVIRTGSLIRALNEGTVVDAVLDVWENEPDADRELIRLSTIATPHIAGYSVAGKLMGTAMIVRAVSRQFGFGMDDWMPDAGQPEIEIHLDAKGLAEEDGLRKAMDRICPLKPLSRRLKTNPETFMSLRKRYPFRPETGNCRVQLENSSEWTRGLLNNLGFRISMNS